jgi:hypothetical protein
VVEVTWNASSGVTREEGSRRIYVPRVRRTLKISSATTQLWRERLGDGRHLSLTKGANVCRIAFPKFELVVLGWDI